MSYHHGNHASPAPPTNAIQPPEYAHTDPSPKTASQPQPTLPTYSSPWPVTESTLAQDVEAAHPATTSAITRTYRGTHVYMTFAVVVFVFFIAAVLGLVCFEF
jgi:hypothetical protein